MVQRNWGEDHHAGNHEHGNNMHMGEWKMTEVHSDSIRNG